MGVFAAIGSFWVVAALAAMGIGYYRTRETGVSIAVPLSLDPSTTMQAVFEESHAPASATSVVLRDAPLPTYTSTDVVIRVHAAALNPVDYKILEGNFEIAETLGIFTSPTIGGFDVAGVVVALGSSISRPDLSIGSEVYAMAHFLQRGTIAEYAVLSHKQVALKPSSLSMTQAASLPLVAITNYQALFSHGHLTSNQRVLILGGSGGCGTNAIQLAAANGAHVITTASPPSFDLVKSLGAHEVIDYRSQNFAEVLRDHPVDVVYDTIGGLESYQRATEILKDGGRYVSIVGDNPSPFTFKKIGVVVYRTLSRSWPIASTSYRQFTALANREELDTIARLVDAGKVRPVIDQTYPFTHAAAVEAYQRQASGRSKGKLVFSIIPESIKEE